MCTVTVVAWRNTVRLACNRDEQRARPAALPPQIHRFGNRQAILPIDPTGGGTWIGVNNGGVAITLLNINHGNRLDRSSAPRLSRGIIIPALLHCGSLAEAVDLGQKLQSRHYAPFRLVLVTQDEAAELRSDGEEIRLTWRAALSKPLLFTSSGLGDELVEGPRRELFNDLFSRRECWFAQQDALHRHRWPDRPHLSICMSRPDAHTVSYSVIALSPRAANLTYYPEAPSQAARPITLSLHVRAGGVP
jgi:hypothetical protein